MAAFPTEGPCFTEVEALVISVTIGNNLNQQTRMRGTKRQGKNHVVAYDLTIFKNISTKNLRLPEQKKQKGRVIYWSLTLLCVLSFQEHKILVVDQRTSKIRDFAAEALIHMTNR